MHIKVTITTTFLLNQHVRMGDEKAWLREAKREADRFQGIGKRLREMELSTVRNVPKRARQTQRVISGLSTHVAVVVVRSSNRRRPSFLPFEVARLRRNHHS